MSYNTKFNIFLLMLFIGYVAVDKYLDKTNIVQPQIIVQKDTIISTKTDTIHTPPTIIIKKDTIMPQQTSSKASNESDKASNESGNTSGLKDSDSDSISVQPIQKDSILSDYYELEYKGKQDSTEYTLTMASQTIPYWYKLELQTHIPTVKETKQKRREKQREKQQHTWSISPQVGLGYGLFHSNFDVYCGIGIAYNF